MIRLRQEIQQMKRDAERLANCKSGPKSNPRKLSTFLSWPQPWLIEAILYVILYELPGVRFSHPVLWKAKGKMEKTNE